MNANAMARYDLPSGALGALVRYGLACLLIVLGTLPGSLSAAPMLGIEHPATDTARLSWPSADRDWVLQATPTLTEPDSWRTVLFSPSLAGGTFSLQLALPSGSRSYFFRLLQQVTSGTLGGLNFLYDSQASDGTWGAADGTQIRDTAAAIEALMAFARNDATTAAGLAAVATLSPRNNDELSRQIIGLSAGAFDASSAVTNLRAAGNAATTDTASLDYPGGGWGLATGFGNGTIDTALALRALAAAGKIGGLAIVKETLTASATLPARPFSIPAGATGVQLVARQRTVPVRYTLNYPGGGSSFVDLPASTTPTTVGFPSGAGAFTLTVRNNSASAGTHSAEVSFVGSDGFDFGRVTAALSWLGGVQNPDGGWSLVATEPSHLMITAEVVRGLAASGGAFGPASVLSNAAAWIFTRQNPDGGFSSEPPTSTLLETSLSLLALTAAQTTNSLATAAAYLRAQQLYNGSWANDPLQTALAVRALQMPPVVTAIPGQSVTSPNAFAAINLDGFVADPDHADAQIAWTVTGQTALSVSIINRVATIAYTPGSNISEAVTFTATDPDGNTASATATFAVAFQIVDHTIARGGAATGTRIFTAAEAVLNQAAFYTTNLNGIPPSVTYSTTTFNRISATEMRVGYQISVGAGAATGYQQFQVTYGLLDSGSQPLGPLNGNVFTFTIEVTP